MPKEKLKILFLCTGNSCRSQMAEGFALALRGDRIEPYSAGIEKHGLNPQAVEVMREASVDISVYQSKTVRKLEDVMFDVVITVCTDADQRCPVLPGLPPVVHRPFDDPPHLAKSAATPDAAMSCYRQVRDEIRAYIETLPEALLT